jgi:hypothetical protein
MHGLAPGAVRIQVREALPLLRRKPATWEEGIAAAYHFDLKRPRVFVSPDVGGWAFVVGALGLPKEEHALNLAVRLSGDLETTVQFFVTHRVVELHGWVLAQRGKLVRAYAYVGESDAVLFDRGEPTKVERALPAERRKVPNEQTVTMIAGAWSVDPTTLDAVEGGTGMGVVGELPTELWSAITSSQKDRRRRMAKRSPSK